MLAGERERPSIEYPCHSPQQDRWFLCSINGVWRGRERLAVVSHVDVSALKSFEAQLSASNAALLKSQELSEAANRAKTAFLANMSHEIRTPLTSILGFVDLLRDEGDHDLDLHQRIQALDAIKNAGEHLLVVINDILDISKVEADKMTVERVDMSLVDTLTDIDHLLRPLAAAKGMEFDITFATPLPERIVGDPTRLRQILLNVAGNAVKFTDKGKVTLRAGLQPHGGATRLVIDIDDTGLGLAPDQIQKLFHAFGQADGSTTRKYGGTGLGLALSRRMAELMDGSVTLVRSSPGQGSCFRVELSLEFLPGVAMISHFEAEPIAKIPTDTEQHTILRGRILLAEDGPDNQRLIALHLRKAGALVEVADNGRVALKMLDAARASRATL